MIQLTLHCSPLTSGGLPSTVPHHNLPSTLKEVA